MISWSSCSCQEAMRGYIYLPVICLIAEISPTTRIILSAFYCLYHVLDFKKKYPKVQTTKAEELSFPITMLPSPMVILKHYIIILIKLIAKCYFSGTHENISEIVQFCKGTRDLSMSFAVKYVLTRRQNIYQTLMKSFCTVCK